MEYTGNSSIRKLKSETMPSVSGISELQGSSPDLLKNTPSNIARLEDEIEHSKGRQKYLARTKSPSDGEDVRWYFCKVPLAEKQLSASLPQKELAGKSDYFRFSIRDSLALEASFLQNEEELLSYWWKEYAECSEGPRGSCDASSITSNYETNDLYVVDEERVGVPVKGGLYEVDLTKRHCFPVYWHGENRRVLRGHWFGRESGLDWLPLREDVAEQLELAYRCQIWHRRTFQPSGLFAARVDMQGIVMGLHALFTGEDDTWEAWLVYGNSGFSLNLGRGNMIRLRRGFSPSGSSKPTQDELRQQKEEEMDDYCSQVPVGHLVFMVHGIGQRSEKANLVDDVGDFRRITANLAEKHLSTYQRSIQRVLIIPCQWRKGLKLSGESTVEKITLDGVHGLRVTLSATVHDVLYYMSPIYCQDIIDSVSYQLNSLYAKFLKRNPGYDGKVSIYAHSLGSVLSYDILCHQDMHEECEELEPQIDTATQSVRSDESETKHIPCITVEDNRQNTNFNCEAKTEDFAHVISPVVMGEKQNESARDSLLANRKVESELPDVEDNKFSEHKSLLEEDMARADQQSTTANKCGEEDCMPHAGMGSFEPKAVTSAIVADAMTDKDKLISLLEDEVNCLKARIAELEQKHLCATSPNNEKKCSVDEFSVGYSHLGEDSRKIYKPQIRYTKLAFRVDTFFAVGSPLGVFLALRNVRIGIGRGQDYWQDERISEEMPRCSLMFNIFHPYDPVAYRIEPLVCKEYVSRRPVIIPYHRGGKRLHIGFQEFKEKLAARSQAVASQVNFMKVKVVSVFKPKNKNEMEGAENVENKDEEEEVSYGSLMIQRLTRSKDGHIDHVLQDKTFRHQYISALGAHTNYWRDKDTALFILKHLYRDIPLNPYENQINEGCSQSEEGHSSLYYDKDILDEDLPLTFTDSSRFRDLSTKL